MRSIIRNGNAEGRHDGKRPHIADEIVVAEGSAPVAEDNPSVAGGPRFFKNSLHVPRRQELPFLDMERFAGLCRLDDEIGLPAQEGWDLEDVEDFRGRERLFGKVDIREDWDPIALLDFTQDRKPLCQARASEGVERESVGLVVAGLEDEVDAAALDDRDESLGAFERMFPALYDARAGDQGQLLAFADRERSNLDLFHKMSPLGYPMIIRRAHTSCKEAGEAGIVIFSHWTDSSVDRAPAF